MSYDIHITRADDWTESEGQPISQDEWTILAESDTELLANGYVEFGGSGSDFRFTIFEYQGDTVDEPAGFYWYEGRIEITGANEGVIEKAKRLAEKLAAKVFGDDGEEY